MTSVPRNGGITPGGNGWRKATAALALTEEMAEEGARLAVPKSRAIVAVKRVGAHIGLKAGDMLLLDTLSAFTQAQDWEAGRRPIVWASNAYLMEQTGFSLSALKRHARRLGEAGVIGFRDSPNGKRWGRRDADGVIVEAYGFDLSPLAARAEEFERLQAALQVEREHCRQLKRRITVARRTIRAQLEAAVGEGRQGPWVVFQETFAALLARLPRRSFDAPVLDQLARGFEALRKRVERAFLRVIGADEKQSLTLGKKTLRTKELDPREVVSEPHTQITNELDPVTGNRSETEQTESVPPRPEKPAQTELQHEAKTCETRGVALDVPTIMQACPEFATWAREIGGYLTDWGDVYRVAGQLRPMIGVSDHAWHDAQEHLGKQKATAALVLVFDKHAKGEVTSPGGYLRGMVDKAGAGELHLERSIFGRLSGQAA